MPNSCFFMPIEEEMNPIPVGSMASAMSFGCSNPGFQMGANHGSVTNLFHLPVKETKEINSRPCTPTENPDEDIRLTNSF
jgi:hypothetical protein